MAIPCKSVNQPGWLDLREQLWPHHPSAEHLAEMASFLASPERFAQFIEYDHSGNALGFVEVALRSDYVNGTNSSPVAFLEGIYVVPQARRQGIARTLVAEAERWATSVGCSEFASDALIDNTRSHAMHSALGFEETERVVFFKKTLRSHRVRLNSDVACHLQPDTSTAGQESTMTVHLDHLMVPSRNKSASAKLLAELLGVPWSETGVGPFAPVYVNDGLTFDFDEWTDPIPLLHYCFRVGEEDFNVILERIKAAGIPFRSNVHGPVDFQINTQHGGSIVYWNEPDGHQWEMLTVSYAREA